MFHCSIYHCTKIVFWANKPLFTFWNIYFGIFCLHWVEIIATSTCKAPWTERFEIYHLKFVLNSGRLNQTCMFNMFSNISLNMFNRDCIINGLRILRMFILEIKLVYKIYINIVLSKGWLLLNGVPIFSLHKCSSLLRMDIYIYIYWMYYSRTNSSHFEIINA